MMSTLREAKSCVCLATTITVFAPSLSGKSVLNFSLVGSFFGLSEVRKNTFWSLTRTYMSRRPFGSDTVPERVKRSDGATTPPWLRSEEHTSELQSHVNLV